MATAPDPDERYPIKATDKGYCIIINNENFTYDKSHPRSVELKGRAGSQKDKEALIRTFEKLRFIVKCYEDQTDTQMAAIMKEVADDPRQEHFDIFVCCILTHGSLGQVYGCNGVPVDIKDLTYSVKPFYCPRLAGKPKVFFIQACQGSAKQRAYAARQTDGGEEAEEADAIPTEEELIPNDSDFLLSYATVPGYVSWRNTKHGSRYIRHLTDCLNEFAHSKDLLHLHLMVNRRVAKEVSTNKQAAATFFTLRKELFLSAQSAAPMLSDTRQVFNMSTLKTALPVMYCKFDPMSARPSRSVILELRAEGERHTPCITSLLVDPTSSYVYMTDNNNKSIKVASLQSGKLLSTLKLDVKPWSATLDPSDGNTLFVTPWNDYVISCIDVTNKSKLEVKKTITAKRKYSGVSSVLSGSDVTLVVSCEEDEDGRASVDVITLDGGHVRTVVSGDTLPGLHRPDFLCLGNNNTDLFVPDYINFCVYRVELSTGRVTDTLKHPDLKYPCQVCTDSAGNLYVASFRGECVVVRSVDGKWRKLLTGEEHGEGECVYPMGLSVSATGLVVSWTSGDDSVVKKYDLV